MGNELPEGWGFQSIQNSLDFVIGGDWGIDPEKISEIETEEVYCIRGSEIKNWDIEKGQTSVLRKIKPSSLEKRQLKEGDILLEISGGGPEQPVGRTVIIDFKALNHFELPIVCTNFLRLLRFNKRNDSYYINYFLKSFYLSGEIVKYQGGSNNLRNLKFKEFEKIEIPLPPLNEQQRIVAKLDSLFAHLEETKKRLEKFPELLKQFRQAVLTQAVTGKLTGCKVEENKLGNLLIDVKYGTSQKSLYDIDGFPVFRIPNINEGEIDDTDLKFSQLDEKEYNQLKVKIGDVLVIRSNGSISLVGKSAIIRKKHEGFTYAGYLIRLRPGEKITGDFLNYTLMSDFVRRQIVSKAHSSSGVNNINSQELKDLIIKLPTIKEQTEIVRRVESLFAMADAIEAQYKKLKEQIDQLPQAILAKAFRGEV